MSILFFKMCIRDRINGILFEAMLLRYLPKERIEYMIDPDEISEMDGFRILGQKKKQRLIVSTDNVVDPVSYTHLDVYKRQHMRRSVESMT